MKVNLKGKVTPIVPQDGKEAIPSQNYLEARKAQEDKDREDMMAEKKQASDLRVAKVTQDERRANEYFEARKAQEAKENKDMMAEKKQASDLRVAKVTQDERRANEYFEAREGQEANDRKTMMAEKKKASDLRLAKVAEEFQQAKERRVTTCLWSEMLTVWDVENLNEAKKLNEDPPENDPKNTRFIPPIDPKKSGSLPPIDPKNSSKAAYQNQRGKKRTKKKITEFEFGQENEISKYLLLNKGLRSFIKLIVDHSPSDESAPVISSADEKILWRGFDAYKDVIAHKKKLYSGRFKWDIWEDSLKRVSELIHPFIKIQFPLYHQIVDPEIFQFLFPVESIQAYMYMPFLGDYLKADEFIPVLTLQTDLARLFLIFHLKADTKYLAKTDSDQLGILDPFFRNKMRLKNRQDPLFARGGKYNSGDFNIKDFLCQCIKLFFQPLGFCEITGYDFYLQSTILEILRYTLELGIWKYQELRDVVKLLFEKIQALISFRERYLVEIVKHQNDTEQKRTLEERIKDTKDNRFTKLFLDECREQCAAICLQIIFLINDDELHEAFHSKERYNPKDKEYIEKSWEYGYFSNIEFNYLINSIFTTFIIKFTPDKNNKNLSMMTNKILMLITDRANDDFIASMNMADEKSFLWLKENSNYRDDDEEQESRSISPIDSVMESAIVVKKKLIGILDAMTKGWKNGNLDGISRKPPTSSKMNGKNGQRARNPMKFRNTRWHWHVKMYRRWL
jgi:hypothetical protein